MKKSELLKSKAPLNNLISVYFQSLYPISFLSPSFTWFSISSSQATKHQAGVIHTNTSRAHEWKTAGHAHRRTHTPPPSHSISSSLTSRRWYHLEMRWIRVIIDKSAVGANAAEVRASIFTGTRRRDVSMYVGWSRERGEKVALLLTGYILGGAGAADAASNAGISTCSADVAFPNLLNASVLLYENF